MSAVLQVDRKLVINQDFMQAPNLCDRLKPDDLAKIGKLVTDGYKRDEASRQKWMRRSEAGMDLAMQIQQSKSFPWPGSANVVFPLLSIAALQFSARSYSNIIQGTDVVRYRVGGEDKSGAFQQKADRIARHMSWQVLEEDQSWEEQHDRLLINLAIVGCSFIKTFFNPDLGHNTSELVQARDFVLDYHAKSVESCARKTHLIKLYRNEIYTRVKSKIFNDCLNSDWFCDTPDFSKSDTQGSDNRHGTSADQPDEDTPFELLEQHRLLDLDQDGYAEPYTVTVEKNSGNVTRLVTRWDREEDIERTIRKEIIKIRPTEYFTKYSFIPAPDGGIYDVGFGTLIGPLNETVNSGINQLLDAGTMANSSGGFLGRGAKIRGGTRTVPPWTWVKVDSTGDDLRKNMISIQSMVKEPSMVLFNLVSLLINYTDRMSGSTDVMVGENPGQNTPAETSRNMVEQGMQVYSTIFKRVWRSMKEEFRKLHRLNGIYLPSRKRFGSGDDFITQEDYKSNSDLVVPAADPNVTSKSMKIQKAQAVREASMQMPGYDLEAVERNFLKAMEIENIDIMYPGADKAKPLPNPKAEVEKLKLQAAQMKFEHEKQMMVLELSEVRRLNDAKIHTLNAQAIKLVAEVGNEKAELQLKAFETAMNAFKMHNEMIDSRIQTISGGSKNGDDQAGRDGAGSNTGGIPRLAAPPDDGGLPEGVGSLGGGAEGTVG